MVTLAVIVVNRLIQNQGDQNLVTLKTTIFAGICEPARQVRRQPELRKPLPQDLPHPRRGPERKYSNFEIGKFLTANDDNGI